MRERLASAEHDLHLQIYKSLRMLKLEARFLKYLHLRSKFTFSAAKRGETRLLWYVEREVQEVQEQGQSKSEA